MGITQIINIIIIPSVILQDLEEGCNISIDLNDLNRNL